MSIGIRGFAFSLAAAILLAPFTALTAAAAKGDPVSVKLTYTECEGCHTFRENKVGPKYCGVVGRKAASLTDYPSYFEALRSSGLAWDVKTLDEFLAEPYSYLPGTAMGYVGISDKESRVDLIAYMALMGSDPNICGVK